MILFILNSRKFKLISSDGKQMRGYLGVGRLRGLEGKEDKRIKETFEGSRYAHFLRHAADFTI